MTDQDVGAPGPGRRSVGSGSASVVAVSAFSTKLNGTPHKHSTKPIQGNWHGKGFYTGLGIKIGRGRTATAINGDANADEALARKTGAGRLQAMIKVGAEKFGARLCLLMKLGKVTEEEIAALLGKTKKQVEYHYMGGRQFPKYAGMYTLHIVFGVPMGQTDGTEELDRSLIDPAAIRARLEEYT